MKEKKNAATEWIIFSVLSVIVPVLFAFIISSIINNKIIDLSEIIESVILVVFSIACSLLSICWSVNKQRSDKFTKMCFWVSGFTMFLSWTVYIYSLTKNKIYLKHICIGSLIFVIICSILGIILGRKSDKNENDNTCKMHDNCNKIRSILVSNKCNIQLFPLTKRKYDLLCNPDEFDRVEEVLNNLNNDLNNEVTKSERPKG